MPILRASKSTINPVDRCALSPVHDPTDPKIAAANAANAKYWRQAKQAAERKALIQQDTPPVNILGGYKFPNAPKIDLSPALKAAPSSGSQPIGDGLEIPDFLKRTRDEAPAIGGIEEVVS